MAPRKRLRNAIRLPSNAATKAKTAIKATKVQFTVAKSIGIVRSCLTSPKTNRDSLVELALKRDCYPELSLMRA
jgi:hypothetical protein